MDSTTTSRWREREREGGVQTKIAESLSGDVAFKAVALEPSPQASKDQ